MILAGKKDISNLSKIDPRNGNNTGERKERNSKNAIKHGLASISGPRQFSCGKPEHNQAQLRNVLIRCLLY